jgi:hypothetical protein
LDLLVIGRYVAADEKGRRKEREKAQSIISAHSMVHREEAICVTILLHLVLPMHFNQTTSIVSNADGQIFSSCGNTVWSLLFIHLCYTWLITWHILFPCMLVLMMLSGYFWSWYRCDHHHDHDVIDSPEDEQNDPASDTLRRYILREIHLILVYLCVAFVFTSLISHRTVNWITVARWCIEAAWIPHIALTLIGTYANLSCHHLIDFDMPYAATMIYLIKGTLFVWMRYAEWYPSSELNDFQTFFFYEFCNELGLHRIPDDHYLRRFMLDSRTSKSS